MQKMTSPSSDSSSPPSSIEAPPTLPPMVYSMACFYLAMVGLVGLIANGFVAFLYCKSKKVRTQLSSKFQLKPNFLLLAAAHPLQQAADVPGLGGGHHCPVWDTCRLPRQLEQVRVYGVVVYQLVVYNNIFFSEAGLDLSLSAPQQVH